MSMSDGRRRVLLTGATGNWGRATLRALRERPEIAVQALVLPAEAAPGAASRLEAGALRRARARTLAAFADMENLQILRGDLTNPADVARAVEVSTPSCTWVPSSRPAPTSTLSSRGAPTSAVFETSSTRSAPCPTRRGRPRRSRVGHRDR